MWWKERIRHRIDGSVEGHGWVEVVKRDHPGEEMRVPKKVLVEHRPSN